MNVVRFSAIGNFGVPIDSENDIENPARLVALMHSYGIEGTEIATEITDITPFYWKNSVYQYMLSRRNNGATVDLLPRHDDSQAYLIGNTNGLDYAAESPVRTYVIPGDIVALPIAGLGPRFAGKICIHELIINL